MTQGCKIDKQDAAYFLTFTIVKWASIFKENYKKQILCDSLNYCINKKGLEIFSYVIMNTHMHLIAASKQNNLSSIVRDIKKFTAGTLIELLISEQNRSSATMLEIFKKAATKHSRNKNYQLWQQHNHPEEVYSPKFILSKIKYIHNNPVEAGIVNRPEEYFYSSAVDYAGGLSPVNVTLLNLHNLYY
jgi:REP element-mobilizing transposase RayT